jgi:uncharacterized phage protein (TIGR02216 family)
VRWRGTSTKAVLAEAPLHHRFSSGGPPPRAGEDFKSTAARLAGFAGAFLHWSPNAFWDATPAELACIVRALVGEDTMPPDAATIRTLMEAFPDG